MTASVDKRQGFPGHHCHIVYEDMRREIPQLSKQQGHTLYTHILIAFAFLLRAKNVSICSKLDTVKT